MTYLTPIMQQATQQVSSVVTSFDLFALVRYLADVIAEGDHLNDWLTHLPSHWVPVVTEIGVQLSELFGG
jgi:hypothetical protein